MTAAISFVLLVAREHWKQSRISHSVDGADPGQVVLPDAKTLAERNKATAVLTSEQQLDIRMQRS